MPQNWQRAIARARSNWTKFLTNTGNTVTIKRREYDTDGASIGQGTTIEHTGVPFCENLGGSNNPPTTVGGGMQRRGGDVYEPYAVSLSFPYGSDVKLGDRVEQEPIGTGLPVWDITWVDFADPLSIDLEANATVVITSKH